MKKDLILFEIILKEVDVTDDCKPIIKKEVKINIDAIEKGLFDFLKPIEYQTLLLIASHIDKEGKCYPTQERIATLLGITRQAVGSYVHKLKDTIINDTPLLIVHQTTYNGNKKLIYEVPVAKLGKYVPYDEMEHEVDNYKEGTRKFRLDD